MTAGVPLMTTFCENKDFFAFVSCLTITAVNTARYNAGVCVPDWDSKIKVGFEDCHLCNDDPFRPCSSVRCAGLGTDCCYGAACGLPTNVCDASLEALQNCDETINDNLVIETENLEFDIAYNEYYLQLDVETSKSSNCKYGDIPEALFEDLIDFDTGDRAGIHHSTSLWAGDPLIQNYSYFIRCEWACSGESIVGGETVEYPIQRTEYKEVTIQREEKPDDEPPVIIDVYPYAGQLLEATDSMIMWVKADEPLSECNYAVVDYDAIMEQAAGLIDESIESGAANEAAAEELLEQLILNSGLGGGGSPMEEVSEYQFKVNLSVTPGTNYGFNIICTDESNIDSRPKPMFFRISNDFEVVITYPENNNEYVDYIESIEVSSGATDTECRYSIEEKLNYFEMIDFDITGERAHLVELLTPLTSGEHNIYVSCVDYELQDLSTGESTFTVIPDTTPPSVVRIYTSQSGGYSQDINYLKIILNELSSCTYSIESFGSEQSDMFSSGDGQNGYYTHYSLQMSSENSAYYIICKDLEENPLQFMVYP